MIRYDNQQVGSSAQPLGGGWYRLSTAFHEQPGIIMAAAEDLVAEPTAPDRALDELVTLFSNTGFDRFGGFVTRGTRQPLDGDDDYDFGRTTLAPHARATVAHGDRGAAALQRGLSSSDPVIRHRSLGTLSFLGEKALTAQPDLERLLTSPDPLDRELATFVLGTIGPSAASSKSALLARLDDPSPRVVLNAIIALRRLGIPNEELRVPLAAVLRTIADDQINGTSPTVRHTPLLDGLRPNEREFLNYAVTIEASISLADMGPAAAPIAADLAESYRRLISVPHGEYAPTTPLITLAAIGPDARPALPTLWSLLDTQASNSRDVQLPRSPDSPFARTYHLLAAIVAIGRDDSQVLATARARQAAARESFITNADNYPYRRQAVFVLETRLLHALRPNEPLLRAQILTDLAAPLDSRAQAAGVLASTIVPFDERTERETLLPVLRGMLPGPHATIATYRAAALGQRAHTLVPHLYEALVTQKSPATAEALAAVGITRTQLTALTTGDTRYFELPKHLRQEIESFTTPTYFSPTFESRHLLDTARDFLRRGRPSLLPNSRNPEEEVHYLRTMLKMSGHSTFDRRQALIVFGRSASPTPENRRFLEPFAQWDIDETCRHIARDILQRWSTPTSQPTTNRTPPNQEPK